MGQLVYIIGRSGTGKSYSMRNFPPEKLAVVNVQGKVFPFRGAGKIETENTDQSDKIVKKLKEFAKNGFKSIVVDDFQYTMANEFMRRSTERGYDKFTDMGRHAWDIANTVQELPQDVVVYIMCHIDRDEDGNEKIKTIGKLLDEKICLEGMSTIVLKTNVTDGVYTFLTQNNGRDTVKSPAGMFPTYAVDNDLWYVDQKIRNYYQLGEFITDEEAKEIDEAAKNVDVIKDDGKKGRRRAKKEEPKKAPAEEKEEAGSTDRTKESFEKAKRKARRSAEEVKEANAEAVANTGMDESGDAEEVPFDEVEELKLEKPARKTRKDRTKENEETSAWETGTSDEKEDTAGDTGAMPEPEPAAPARRRRRKA